ncbi:swi5-dependent recombination DNA repair protein 1 homolog isoform X1 [Microtus ochrogaster]|uniref:Swi5-dependent recombination DNA repair protein 1 homolog n=1 Tax=Microtus ochrogaster TaxID=79684 RepID=A0ABM0KTI7_MICOH|nr:swi5-dependent recombination DNA repair protein 1 homolog isoform X1 [Microtus ochrogaster]
MAEKEGNQEFASKMESPSDSSSTKMESPSDSASAKMESPSDSASAKMESPSDSASAKMERPSDSASAKMESPSNSTSTKMESPSDSASTMMESPSNSTSTKMESPSDSSSIKMESPSDSSSTKVESASDSASTKMESESDSTLTKMEIPSDSSSTKMESTSDSTSTKMESPSDCTSIKMEVSSDSASTKMESASDSASTLPDTLEKRETPSSSQTNSSGKQPMSGTLKERLKKTRASSHSFCSVVKRLKVENEENDETVPEPGVSSKGKSCSEVQESVKHIDSESEKDSSESKNTCKSKSPDTGSPGALQNDSVSESTKERLREEKAKLTKQVQEKEELLRRLKLVKMYRIKNNLAELEMLIKKWRRCSQRLLYELQSVMSEDDEKLSITELIDYYGVDENVVHYNRSEEEFTGV